MACRNQATQHLAVQLLLHHGEDRKSAAACFEQFAREAREALGQLPGHDSPHAMEYCHELEQVAKLAKQVVEWHEQTEQMPLELCDPEPNLVTLTEFQPPCLGCLPWYLVPNRVLTQCLARTLSEQDELGRVHLAVMVFGPAVQHLTACADALEWPALSDLSRGLGVVLTNLN